VCNEVAAIKIMHLVQEHLGGAGDLREYEESIDGAEDEEDD
jgi:hypothetical protein